MILLMVGVALTIVLAILIPVFQTDRLARLVCALAHIRPINFVLLPVPFVVPGGL